MLIMQFRLLLWTASLIFCISFLKFGRSSFLFNKKHIKNNARVRSTSFDSSFDTRNVTSVLALKKKLDFEFLNVALPAFVALAADPLASFVDAVYVGRLGVKDQAGMGIAISTQYSLAKLYNDPLLKTSTSLVAGKSGDDLSASVATSLMIATSIGLLQMIVFLVFTSQLLTFMSVAPNSDMRQPAIAYLKWRALGIPAATMLLVTNSIFRGRGDTKTPLYCTFLGNIVNIILDPILIFTCHMGCGGAGAATAISQWVTAVPLLYLLYKSIPFNIFRIEKESLRNAFKSYLNAGGLILLRTIAKISAYAITASAAARLGSVAMAAYALTFNLGFATSQLCEAVSVAAQVLIAREVPFNSEVKKIKVQHVIRRALLAGVLVSGGLSVVTQLDLDRILNKLTNSKEVFEAAKGIMPIVLITQLAKGLTYSTGGIILGGLDWSWSTASMMVASILSTAMVYTLKPTLWNIWLALAVFMSSQVVCAMVRIISKTGPWSYLKDSDRNVVPKTA